MGKYIKMNSLLIIIMLYFSFINTSQSYSEENSELEELMQNNANDFKEDTELNKFYEKVNHEYNNKNDYDLPLPSNENTKNLEKSEEIKLIEKTQKKEASKIKGKKEKKKTHYKIPRFI